MAENKKTHVDAKYDASSIQKLDDIEHVRKRPRMYIPAGKEGNLHLCWELIDNAIDEALAGYGDEIIFEMHEDDSMSVTDFGRGVPVEPHPTTGESTLLMIFGSLGAGGKFSEDGGYKVSGGLHGVGSTVANALSKFFEVEVRSSFDNSLWKVRFEQGYVSEAPKSVRKLTKDERIGTTIRWQPDVQIFGADDLKLSPTVISQRLRDKSFLLPGLAFRFRAPGREEEVFKAKRGIADLVAHLNEDRKKIHPSIAFFDSEGKALKGKSYVHQQIAIEFALQWTYDDDENLVKSYANLVNTIDGGTHLLGLRTGLVNVLNELAWEQKKLKRDKELLDRKDVMVGLTGVLSLKLPESLLEFDGQAKHKLSSKEANSATATFAEGVFDAWMRDKKNSKEATAILERVVDNRNWRLQASKKSKSSKAADWLSSTTPEKLADCDTDNTPVEERELFIVEGDSAAGSGKDARYREFQAIMPVRGKVLNVYSATASKAFANAEIDGLLQALGGKKEMVGRRLAAVLTPEMRRYGKVVICADADPDGAHINMLLLTVFYRLFPQLIREGRLFLAQPPLFRLRLDSKGERNVYAWTDEERSALMAKHKLHSDAVTRFKGLGEMDPDSLRETTFDPKTRSLLQVVADDGTNLEEAVALLMGGGAGHTRMRKQWVEELRADVADPASNVETNTVDG